jgi:hypothetical protein
MKVVLSLDAEKERVLTQSLHLYKEMIEETLNGSALQREIARGEVRIVQQLLMQLMVVGEIRGLLPVGRGVAE